MSTDPLLDHVRYAVPPKQGKRNLLWIVHTPLYTAGMTRNRHLEASTVKTLESHFHGPVGTDPSTKPSELSPVGKGSSGLLDGHRLRWRWQAPLRVGSSKRVDIARRSGGEIPSCVDTLGLLCGAAPSVRISEYNSQEREQRYDRAAFPNHLFPRAAASKGKESTV